MARCLLGPDDVKMGTEKISKYTAIIEIKINLKDVYNYNSL